MKIVTVVGARPQFIKAALLSRAIAKHPGLQEVMVHTGQHYDFNMNDIFFNEMGIPKPAHHLHIGNCSQGAMTGRMMESVEAILIKEKPDWVLVYGDTNSTLAGALAAVKLSIPIAHVEAGLRSFNKKMPEEINRILTDHCADLLFTTSKKASQQLEREGIDAAKICLVGDIMLDALVYYQGKAKAESQILETLGLSEKQYALATIHRPANTDYEDKLREIVHGFASIARETKVVWPMHPRTRQALQRYHLLDYVQQTVQMIDPVGYLDMIQLERSAQVIMTDSGGVQKEAYFLNVPCLTLREETEWEELIEQGCNCLVPIDRESIFLHYKKALSRPISWNRSLYGEGNTADKILSRLL